MDEIFTIADRATILRDGQHVVTAPMCRVHAGVDDRAYRRPARRADSHDVERREATRASRCRAAGRLAGRASRATSTSTCIAARSSAWPGCSAAAAARSPGCCAASTRCQRRDPDRGQAGAIASRRRDRGRHRAGSGGPAPAGLRRSSTASRQQHLPAGARPAQPRGWVLAARPKRLADGADRAPAGSRPLRATPRSARSPAATSRRSSSPSGWPPSRTCSSSTSRPPASTSAASRRSSPWSASSPRGQGGHRHLLRARRAPGRRRPHRVMSDGRIAAISPRGGFQRSRTRPTTRASRCNTLSAELSSFMQKAHDHV